MADNARIVSLPAEDDEKIGTALKRNGADEAPIAPAPKILVYINPPGVCMEVEC